MKKKMLEELDIAKKCAFCEHASETLTPDCMICRRRGVVSADFHCRAFAYDLMKRQPKRSKSRSRHSSAPAASSFPSEGTYLYVILLSPE